MRRFFLTLSLQFANLVEFPQSLDSDKTPRISASYPDPNSLNIGLHFYKIETGLTLKQTTNVADNKNEARKDLMM